MPASFVDNDGREWTIDLGRKTRRRVFRMTGVILDPDFIEGTMHHLAAAPGAFLTVLYAACSPEARGRQIEEPAFTRAVLPAIVAAGDAFARAAVDLFPEAHRPEVSAALDRTTEELDHE